VTLFFDVNVGTTLPGILKNALKLPVEFHRQHFPINTPDDVWLAQVGLWGWSVIGHDQHLHVRANELAAIKQYNIGCFYLWGAQATRWEKMTCFARAHDRIIKAEAESAKPFIYRITQSGLLRPIIIT
jgi:hypothetical protein